MARLIVNQLGAIRSMNIEIKQLTLFIGEQATGKSTLCKAVYFFRSFKELLLQYLYDVALNGKSEYGFPKAMNYRVKDSLLSFLDIAGGCRMTFLSNMNIAVII